MKRTLFSLMEFDGGHHAQPLVAQAAKVDPAIPGYQKASGVSGNLNSIGSDTLNNLMTLWAEGFKKLYPNVKIQIEGKGSSTAPPALIAGTAQLGPDEPRDEGRGDRRSSRRSSATSRREIAHRVDALAVYVHKDNPIKS